jgi:hypothetical protein
MRPREERPRLSAAVNAAQAHARNLLALASAGVDVASVAIGRGVAPEDDIEWHGLYGWVRGAEPVWSPGD